MLGERALGFTATEMIRELDAGDRSAVEELVASEVIDGPTYI